MNNTTLSLSFEDLELLHDVWDKIRSINELYPELLMNGRQADRLRPLNVKEFNDFTKLRDRIGQGLIESNQDLSPEELPYTWEITEPQYKEHRRARKPE